MPKHRVLQVIPNSIKYEEDTPFGAFPCWHELAVLFLRKIGKREYLRHDGRVLG